MGRNSGETLSDFTLRVQEHMARELGVAATHHTSADKVEYAKRKLFVQVDGESFCSIHPCHPEGINSLPPDVDLVSMIGICRG